VLRDHILLNAQAYHRVTPYLPLRMIETDIVLYQAEWCPYCARVRAKMTDLLLDYKVVNVPHEHAARVAVRELFGKTGIPSMIDGDVKIADDDDRIIEYLEEKYGE